DQPSVAAMQRLLWLRGGLPKSLLASTDQDSFNWRLEYLRSYIENDVPRLNEKIDWRLFRRFLELVASRQASQWNRTECARALGIKARLLDDYVGYSTELLLVRELRPWSNSLESRITKEPKLFIRDTGIYHSLRNISTIAEMAANGDIKGASWEGFATECLVEAAGLRSKVSFYRDRQQREIDLVVEFSGVRHWGFEFKAADDPTISRGNVEACKTINTERCVVVYPGNTTYSRGGCEFMPLISAIRSVESEARNHD
ncbi:MAG: DUF4143 domain-containing protein, partial [Burkholderiaceae bacterium]